MIESLYVAIGLIAGLMLTGYVGYLRQGWPLSGCAVLFGFLTAYEFSMRWNARESSLLFGFLAAVVGGLMFRTAWKAGAAALAIGATLATPVIHALQVKGGPTDIAAGVAGGLPNSAVALSGLFGLALLAIEARRRSALVRVIHQESELNRRLWDVVGNGIVIVDTDSRVVEWNPAIERLSGVSRRVALGGLLGEYPGFNNDRHRECLRFALQGIEITTSDHMPPLDDQTATVPFSRGYYSPLRGEGGGISGALVIIT